MIKLTRGQKTVLILTSLPMAAVGFAGGIAAFSNMKKILHDSVTSLGLVAAGEGATLICAMVTLSLTLLGQHTPAAVRLGLWLLPMTASGAGVILAPSTTASVVVMAMTPMAMTVAGEGVALTARRIVRFQTGIDLEAQRRTGLLMWHARRSQTGRTAFARRLSELFVWRLTRKVAVNDKELSLSLSDIHRDRIADGADADLSAALSWKKPEKPKKGQVSLPELTEGATPALPAPDTGPGRLYKALPPPPRDRDTQEVSEDATEPLTASEDGDDGWKFIKGVLTEAEQKVLEDPGVRLLSVAEVAAMKNVTATTVHSWARRGRLPVHGQDENGRKLFHPVAVARIPAVAAEHEGAGTED